MMKNSKVSLKYGAEIPFMRPSIFAEDGSPDIDVFKHCLEWLKKNENYNPEVITHLRPTGPARKASLVDKAIKKILDNKKADSLRSVSLASQTPDKMWFFDKKNEPNNQVARHENLSESHSMPRQMRPKAYWQNGYVDIIKRDTIVELNSMVGNYVLPFLINHVVHDLDYLDDIPLVEKALKSIINNDQTNDFIIDENRHPV